MKILQIDKQNDLMEDGINVVQYFQRDKNTDTGSLMFLCLFFRYMTLKINTSDILGNNSGAHHVNTYFPFFFFFSSLPRLYTMVFRYSINLHKCV